MRRCILFVMGMGVAHGEEVVLASDNEAVLDQLAAMLATDLDAKSVVTGLPNRREEPPAMNGGGRRGQCE